MLDSTQVIARYLAFRIAEESRNGVTLTELAKRAGITHAQVSTIRSGNRGVGMKSITGLASAFGLSLAELESAAAEWAKANPAKPDARVVRDARYPNLEAAIAFAGASSVPVTPAAIEYVRSQALKSNDDLPAEKWLEELRFAERLMREREAPALPGREIPAPEQRAPIADRIAAVKARRKST